MAAMSWADRAAMAAGEPEPVAPIMTRSATQFATQAAERAKFQPQGEAEAAFLAAIDRCVLFTNQFITLFYNYPLSFSQNIWEVDTAPIGC